MKRLRIATEGIPLLLTLIVLSIALWIIYAASNSTTMLWVAALMTILTVGITFLFRNPHRTNPDLSDFDIISPADGKIVTIGTAEEPDFMKEKALRMSIFLSLPDVHTNWVPVSGTIMHKKCSDGKFLPAFTKGAVEKNKRVSIGIQCADGFRMTIVQMTGFVARRIKCHLTPGQKVQRGERYGMIYFGSRVDVFVPRDTTLTVQEGDRVQGGFTVIGRKNTHHGETQNTPS